MARVIFKSLFALMFLFQMANSENKDITITQGSFYKCVTEITDEDLKNKDVFINTFNIQNLFFDAQSSGYECTTRGCSKNNKLINQDDNGVLVSVENSYLSSEACLLMIEHVVPRGYISKAMTFAEAIGAEGKSTSIQEYGNVSLTVIIENNGVFDYKKTCQIKVEGINEQKWR